MLIMRPFSLIRWSKLSASKIVVEAMGRLFLFGMAYQKGKIKEYIVFMASFNGLGGFFA